VHAGNETAGNVFACYRYWRVLPMVCAAFVQYAGLPVVEIPYIHFAVLRDSIWQV
jgi:hypothetical protein